MTYEYQDWYQSIAPKPRDPVRCPVCDTLFGYRSIKDEPFMEHCDDCQATYTWKVGEKSPSAVLDSAKKKSKKCDCGNCA